MSTREPEEWSAESLVEHVWRIDRRMHDRRFCFILGAGASVQSGIPAAGALVRRWLGELHQRHARGRTLEQWATAEGLEIDGFQLADATSFYSQVFARRFRQHPEEGYADLEDIMQGKEPSFGYSVLANVLAETRHKLVITTNFDNLVADALSIFTATSPLVCGHESLAPFIRVVPRRPVVVKIHRDLLMAPMNRAEEIGALQSPWREPLTRVFSTYTPIVVGYGGNDGSLMGFLKGLPDPIQGGMFWCYWGPGGPPAADVRALVAQHNGALVPIDGFDELMLLLSAKLGIPFLDQVLEQKSRTRLENYRRRKEELLARVFPPPPPREDIAAPQPAPEDSQPEDEDEDTGTAASADDELPAHLEISPAPPPRAANLESGAQAPGEPPAAAPPEAGPRPVPPASSPAAERSARAAPASPARREPARQPGPEDSPRGAASPPPATRAGAAAPESTRSAVKRAAAGPDLPTLSSRSAAATRSAAPSDAPAPKVIPFEADAHDDVPLAFSGGAAAAVAEEQFVSEGPVQVLQAHKHLQRAMQQLAQGTPDETPFAALMQAHAEPDYARSFELFREALRRYPGDPGLQIGFAERLSEVPDPSSVREAISVLEDLLQRAPDDARALRHLALLKAWKADFRGATAELRRAWNLALSPPREQDLALAAFIAGLFARRGSRNDTRFLAVLKAAVRYGFPELVLPRNLVAGLIKNLDNPSRRLYGALDKMLAEGLPLARVEAAEPRFAAIAPADLATLGPDDAP